MWWTNLYLPTGVGAAVREAAVPAVRRTAAVTAEPMSAVTAVRRSAARAAAQAAAKWTAAGVVLIAAVGKAGGVGGIPQVCYLKLQTQYVAGELLPI